MHGRPLKSPTAHGTAVLPASVPPRVVGAGGSGVAAELIGRSGGACGRCSEPCCPLAAGQASGVGVTLTSGGSAVRGLPTPSRGREELSQGPALPQT